MPLEVRNLVAGYGDVTVLRDVSFTVPEKRVVALLGANGAGKTTALNAVSGLIAEVGGGSVMVDGEEIIGMPAHRRVQAGLAHVPQGRQLFPFMTVRENLELGAYLPRSHARKKDTLDWLLVIFPRLKERLSQSAGSLSGGEQQMCAVARGLMSQPRYVMLDEPSLGLAPIIVKQVVDVIATIVAQGIGILLVEQNVSLALKQSSFAYVLENTSISLAGKSGELVKDDRIRQAYLGM